MLGKQWLLRRDHSTESNAILAYKSEMKAACDATCYWISDIRRTVEIGDSVSWSSSTGIVTKEVQLSDPRSFRVCTARDSSCIDCVTNVLLPRPARKWAQCAFA